MLTISRARNTYLNRLQYLLLSLLVVTSALGGVLDVKLHANTAVTSPQPQAKVSFTFDDAYVSAISQAAPVLSKYGLTGTVYVSTGCVGMTTAPNTCQADRDKTYMTWEQIIRLQNDHGWEIGSHTVTHPYLASSDPVDQPRPISAEQVAQELARSKSDLAARGIDAVNFATPYGDYNMPVLAEIAKYYATQRGFADVGMNEWPYSDYYLKVKQVQAGVRVREVQAAIDQAIANKQWLILVLHDIQPKPSKQKYDYEYATAELDQIAAYVKTKQNAGLIKSINVRQGPVTSDVNLLPNSSFNNGIADGWTTDSPANVTQDAGHNGSYPDPVNAIKLRGGSTTAHLYSPGVNVDPATTYMLKNFLNVQQITGGEVGFYIDEYDSFGNWISGQVKKAERSVFVQNLNFSYKPSSTAVRKASLQIYVTANSGVTAYLDNLQWFPLHSTVPPTQVNLLPNGTFDNGMADGWSTDDPASIQKDGNNNGSPANPLNSIRLASSTRNGHLFSPYVTVEGIHTYSLSSYLNLKQITGGEVGYYIDEFDANGNWISGQYKGRTQAVGSGTGAFQYRPSSVSVVKARLQIIVTGNSGILAYFDDVRWYQN